MEWTSCILFSGAALPPCCPHLGLPFDECPRRPSGHPGLKLRVPLVHPHSARTSHCWTPGLGPSRNVCGVEGCDREHADDGGLCEVRDCVVPPALLPLLAALVQALTISSANPSPSACSFLWMGESPSSRAHLFPCLLCLKSHGVPVHRPNC